MAYQRKDTKTWVATWTDKNRKSHRKSGFTSKKYAELFEARQKLLVETNLVYGVSFQRDLTIENAIDRYLWQAKLQMKESTYNSYVSSFKSLRSFFKQERIELYESITPQIMYEYISFRQDCGVSDFTINGSIHAMRRVCKYVVDNNLSANNPLEKFKGVRVDKQDDVRILSKKDLAIIEEIAQDSIRRDEFFFLARTGCRLSEMINLEVDDIDLEKKRIKIAAKKAKSRKTRYVPMTQSVYKLLKRRVAEAKTAIVFPNKNGKKIALANIWQSFHSVLVKAEKKGVDISRVKIHTLRATYISHMVMQGVDPMKVMRIVGHTKFETMKKYLHLSDEYLNDVPEIF